MALCARREKDDFEMAEALSLARTSLIYYHGPISEQTLVGIVENIDDWHAQFPDEEHRERIVSAVIELVHNMLIHRTQSGGEKPTGDLSVGRDDDGTYVETSAVADDESITILKRAMKRIAGHSEDEFEQEYKRRLSNRDQRHGLGLFDVAETAAIVEGRRMIKVTSGRTRGERRLNIKAYIR